jgi:hypothetical protein
MSFLNADNFTLWNLNANKFFLSICPWYLTCVIIYACLHYIKNYMHDFWFWSGFLFPAPRTYCQIFLPKKCLKIMDLLVLRSVSMIFYTLSVFRSSDTNFHCSRSLITEFSGCSWNYLELLCTGVCYVSGSGKSALKNHLLNVRCFVK